MQNIVNLVVILGQQGDEYGNLSLDNIDRLDLGRNIYDKFNDHIKYIVVCGGKTTQFSPEATQMKNYLVKKHQLNPNFIVEEPLSFTTVENALCLKDHIIFKQFTNLNIEIHLVTSEYHLNRSKRIFEKVFIDVSTARIVNTYGSIATYKKTPEQIKHEEYQQSLFNMEEVNIREDEEIKSWKPLSQEKIKQRLQEDYVESKHQIYAYNKV